MESAKQLLGDNVYRIGIKGRVPMAVRSETVKYTQGQSHRDSKIIVLLSRGLCLYLEKGDPEMAVTVSLLTVGKA